MRARVLAAGFGLADDPAEADVVVVNTCSFITEATEEAISTIFGLLELPRLAQGTAKLVVAGCMPSRYGETLSDELPEVAAFVSCAEEDGIVGILEKVLPPVAPLAPLSPTPPLRTVSAPWAYVKIADGCNRRCSFCTIPHIRGPYRSVPFDEIMAEVAGLVSGGVREIVLIAQDTGIWSDKGGDGTSGTERDGTAPSPSSPSNLAGLLGALAARFPATWFRVMYLQPQGITDELLAVMATHANICNYLDIPLQHASKRVLREMNRAGCGEEYLVLLARIRAALPDVTLRTTVIAGFPGETRADARELERFIEAAAFDYVGVFPYSQEDGTAAGKREDQVPLRTRRARAQRLRDLADAVGFARVAARVGTVEEVLVIERDEDEDGDPGEGVYPLLGRTQHQAPEVDGMVHLDRGNIGKLLSATMVEAYCYELDGRVTGEQDA
jgi:ribosomal protein S12 methylthiotransferase